MMRARMFLGSTFSIFFGSWIIFLHHMFNQISLWMILPTIGFLFFGIYPIIKTVILDREFLLSINKEMYLQFIENNPKTKEEKTTK